MSLARDVTARLEAEGVDFALIGEAQRTIWDLVESEARDTFSSPRALRLCGEIFLLCSENVNKILTSGGLEPSA